MPLLPASVPNNYILITMITNFIYIAIMYKALAILLYSHDSKTKYNNLN